jgi:hypothetical protein
MYFNGEDNYIEIKHFIPQMKFHVSMWYQDQNTDSTLIQIGAEFFEGWGAYYPGTGTTSLTPPTCDPKWAVPSKKGAIEIWHSSCGGLAVDFHDRDDHDNKTVLGRAHRIAEKGNLF